MQCRHNLNYWQFEDDLKHKRRRARNKVPIPTASSAPSAAATPTTTSPYMPKPTEVKPSNAKTVAAEDLPFEFMIWTPCAWPTAYPPRCCRSAPGRTKVEKSWRKSKQQRQKACWKQTPPYSPDRKGRFVFKRFAAVFLWWINKNQYGVAPIQLKRTIL